MNRKLVVDSCVDFITTERNLTTLESAKPEIARVPFIITIDNVEYVDKDYTVVEVLKSRNYKTVTIKTACPSPGDFYSAMKDAAESFVVTISSKLSGAYQSARAAVDVLIEEFGTGKQVHVFDSKSASAGESLIALKVETLIAENEPFSEIVEKTEKYIRSVRTLFALESLDTLVSNGRVSRGQQLASKVLGIFPIMGEDGEGNIMRKDMARGSKNIIPKLVGAIEGTPEELKNCILAITHVNAPERAQEVKKAVLAKFSFKEVHIFEASGLSSVYASNGGIVLAY